MKLSTLTARLSLMLGAAVILSACAVSSTDEVAAPKTETGFMYSKKADFNVTSPKAFNGVDQVVIGSFKVAFIEQKKEARKAGGGLMGGGFGGNASAKLNLTGVDQSLMQDITDAAYADFQQQLRSKGYKIADRGLLTSSPEFQKANKVASPQRDEASFFGSKNTITYLAPRSIGDIYFYPGEAGKTGGFGNSNPMMASIGFASKNNIPVISVTYIVDFANQAGGHGGKWTSSASVKVGHGMSVVPGGGVQLYGGQAGSFSNSNGNIMLGQPVYSTQSFAEVVGTTSDVAKGAEVALNVTSALLGGGTNMTREFEVRANPARYKTVASAVLKDANSKVVSKMSELR